LGDVQTLLDELDECDKEAEELENAMLEALAQTKKAYEFCPGSYTYHAMIAVGRAARALWQNPPQQPQPGQNTGQREPLF
jgi:hypothetical protein